MATIAQGKEGKISITEGSGTEQFLAHMTTWSVESALEMDETPYFGGSKTEEGSLEKTPLSISWTASGEGSAEVGPDNNQDAILEAHNTSKVLSFTFYLNATTAYQGEGYIDSYSASNAADGKGGFTFSVSGNGKIEKITVA